MAIPSTRVTGVDTASKEDTFVSVSESKQFVSAKDADKVSLTEKLSRAINPSKQLENAVTSDQVRNKITDYSKDNASFRYLNAKEQNDIIASVQTSIKDKTINYSGTLEENDLIERFIFNCPAGDDNSGNLIDLGRLKSMFGDYQCGSNPFKYIVDKAKEVLGEDKANALMDNVMDAANSTNGENFIKDLDEQYEDYDVGTYISDVATKTSDIVKGIDEYQIEDASGLYTSVENVYTKAGKDFSGNTVDLSGMCESDTMKYISEKNALSKSPSIDLTGAATGEISTSALFASV